MITANHIRQTFLEHFAKADHTVVASSPLVPHNDPTLMFANAGMNQFKNIFTGAEVAKFPRAASSQKCVRAGGKHNDLDNVGYTARHHTFFEMLGNFSFGDYFKEEAITHAWHLMTKEFGISPEKLGVTVYHTDDEAFNLWKKIAGLPDSKILRVPTKDNFWSMGDTGPCGPCTEIFYDHGVGEGSWSLDATGNDQFGERFVEVWNLVFMQFEAQADGSQVPLPKPSIDTGMGLERIAAVLQGKHNNFDIDLFQALIRASESASGTKAEGARLPSHRIIADHLRASSFLMADGVLPSNEGRGYVLRRIMRRAMRHAHQLGCKEPLMHKLVPALVAEMGDAYPELKRAQAMIVENLRLEEERFKQTLERGLKLLEEESASVAASGALKGDVAFKLYDTFGFPLDLTEDILRGQNKKVDSEGFAACMAEQKARARAAWSGSGETATNKLWFELKDQHGSTEFLGYTQNEAVANVLALVQNDANVASANAGKAFLITNQTPCYGESGGQVGDTGVVLRGKDVIGTITDTQKPLPDFFVHTVELSAPLKTGEEVTLKIDVARRARIRANHSATHILHAVLHRVLGEHVTQKGSLVSAERLRFDISHPKGLSKEDVATIEAEVNRIIWQNSEVSTRLMSPEAAIEAGAMALFGEKYGDEVRVLSMGIDEDRSPSEPSATSHARAGGAQRGQTQKPFSTELCGGTHVARAGDIGVFKIVSEGALAAGVRRIEAVTNAGALEYLSGQDSTLRELALELKVAPDQLHDRLTTLMAERKKFEKELADAKRKLAMNDGAGAEKETIGALTFASRVFDDLAPADLRAIAEQTLKEIGSGVAMVGTGFEGKASIVVAVSADITANYSAVDLIKLAVEAVGGKGGGGKPNMAQGGGPDAGALPQAISAIKASLSQKAAA